MLGRRRVSGYTGTMKLSRRQKHIAWLLVTGLLAGLAVLALHETGSLKRAEWMSHDARMLVTRSDAEIPQDVAIIHLDDDTLEMWEPRLGRFPWPRGVYADLIDFLSLGEPRAIVLDFLFAERQQRGELGLGEDDRALIESTAGAENVHHAFQIWRNVPDEGGEALEERVMPDDFHLLHAIGPAGAFPNPGYNSVVLPFDGLFQAAAGVGNIAMDGDPDGVHRRAHPVTPYQWALYSSLGLSPLLQGEGEDAQEAVPRLEGSKLEIGSRRIPVGEDGRALLNFYGEVPAYSLGGVFASRERLQAGDVDGMLINPAEFEDRIVYLGASAVGLGDIKHTPVDSNMPGVNLHATLAANYLEADFLQAAPDWLARVLVMVFALFTAAALAMRRPVLQFAPPGVLLVMWGGVSIWLFSQNLVVDVVAPSAAIVVSGLAGLAYVSATEGRDKRRVRRMLSQYVSPAVLAEVMERFEDHVHAEVGRSEPVTLLFTDIRGFTSISEHYPPEQVVGLLNRYFSEVTEVIFEYEGTLDKFIGDAVMAFWGAPIRVTDHAERAVLAAVAIHRRLEAFNRRLEADGEPVLHTGLGLHTGEVVLGNIGSERKLDYTVIGDNVNLGSRIEGLTSKYACPVLISETTREALPAEFSCALVDQVRVKGKREAIGIWRPLAVPGDEPARHEWAREVQEATEAAWVHYRAGHWAEALEAWQRLPDGDPIRQLFLARCEQFMRDGAPEEWDGVWTLDSK